MLKDLEQDILAIINTKHTHLDFKLLQKDFYTKIHNYELHLYNLNMYTPTRSKQINIWRQQFRLKLQKSKEETQNKETIKADNYDPKYKKSSEDSDELEETVQLMARQVVKSEKNINELLKSTVKLTSLNVSSKDLKREIDETRRLMNMKRVKEEKEIFWVKIGFLIFLIVCIIILLDKFGVRKLF